VSSRPNLDTLLGLILSSPLHARDYITHKREAVLTFLGAECHSLGSLLAALAFGSEARMDGAGARKPLGPGGYIRQSCAADGEVANVAKNMKVAKDIRCGIPQFSDRLKATASEDIESYCKSSQ
jgi:hypothetical protein